MELEHLAYAPYELDVFDSIDVDPGNRRLVAPSFGFLNVFELELLDKGAVRLESELKDQPLVRGRLLTTIGRVYRSLGLYDRSAATLEKALRTWEEADFGLARALWADPEVMTFLGGPLSDEKVRDKMRSEMACLEKSGVQYWPIFETQNLEFVGCCGLRPWSFHPA